METKFKYHLDKRSRRITSAVIVIIALILGYLIYRYIGSGPYFPAWFLSLASATAALYVLSIPRTIVIDDETFEIHCIVELTSISLENIDSVRTVENSEMKRCIPILGSYGFFGYYGYYFDLKRWNLIRLYASRWSNFVEVTDIFEVKYIVSCDEPQALIEAVELAKRIKKEKLAAK